MALVGLNRKLPAARSSMAPNTLRPSGRGRHIHSTRPLGAIRQLTSQSERNAYSEMGGKGLPDGDARTSSAASPGCCPSVCSSVRLPSVCWVWTFTSSSPPPVAGLYYGFAGGSLVRALEAGGSFALRGLGNAPLPGGRLRIRARQG